MSSTPTTLVGPEWQRAIRHFVRIYFTWAFFGAAIPVVIGLLIGLTRQVSHASFHYPTLQESIAVTALVIAAVVVLIQRRRLQITIRDYSTEIARLQAARVDVLVGSHPHLHIGPEAKSTLDTATQRIFKSILSSLTIGYLGGQDEVVRPVIVAYINSTLFYGWRGFEREFFVEKWSSDTLTFGDQEWSVITFMNERSTIRLIFDNETAQHWYRLLVDVPLGTSR